ncbi:acyltransferase family protein [Tissierella praeacuta]|uniref:acyltransferase family protein n=1 Tax=Tissierella praeacuta TaxID=43131 RepID=UPI0033418D35
MIFFLFMILGICAYKMKYSTIGNYHLDYMSVEKTTSIKGIFVLLIFLSHFVQYVKLNNIFDIPYLTIRNFLGQLVVTMFLFYSGYGILESIKKKKEGYVNEIPTKRILKVLFDFDIAVLLFLILRLIIGYKYDIATIVLSFIGWKSVGNSNWYIFAVLLTYLFTFVSFKIFKNKYRMAISCVTVLSGIYVLVMHTFKPSCWYDTIFCYVAGMWFSLYREQIEKIVLANNISYLLSLVILLTLFGFTYLFKHNKLIIHQVLSLLFVCLVILVTMKVSFNNFILNWIGKHVFSIYILQRIPMMIFKNNNIISHNTYLYLVLCLLVTLVISPAFDKVTRKLYNMILLKISILNNHPEAYEVSTSARQ